MPEFVLLGGLVPDLLCTRTDRLHAGTTDVDVQVDLEIAGGSSQARRLEFALVAAGFAPDPHRAWRWEHQQSPGVVVKAELLADLDDVPNHRTLTFDDCERLGAINLRGTGFAARDWTLRELASADGLAAVQLRVTGIAGYLLAKTHAACGRRATKDWYDIAFVLIHNDLGGPVAAAERAIASFARDLVGPTRTAIDDLRANFADQDAQGAVAFAHGIAADHPELDVDVLANDAVSAVTTFIDALDGLDR